MNKTFDRYTGIVSLVLGISIIVESQKIAESSYGSEVGSNVFPLGLGAALVLLSIRLLYETFRLTYANHDSSKPKLQYKKFLIILGASILYAALLEPLGYVISTFLFLLIGFQTMEKGKYRLSLIIAAAVSAGVYYLYVNIMNGTLPGLPEWLGM